MALMISQYTVATGCLKTVTQSAVLHMSRSNKEKHGKPVYLRHSAFKYRSLASAEG